MNKVRLFHCCFAVFAILILHKSALAIETMLKCDYTLNIYLEIEKIKNKSTGETFVPPIGAKCNEKICKVSGQSDYWIIVEDKMLDSYGRTYASGTNFRKDEFSLWAKADNQNDLDSLVTINFISGKYTSTYNGYAHSIKFGKCIKQNEPEINVT